MMKPYPQSDLTFDKRTYNDRHSHARRISENLFGNLQIHEESFTQ